MALEPGGSIDDARLAAGAMGSGRAGGTAMPTENECKSAMEYRFEETIRLVAEDLRAARFSVGLTSGRAASQAGVTKAQYRALEKGRVPGNQHILRKLVEVCRRLGLRSVRAAYVEEIGQYANIDLSRDRWKEPLTAFVDVVEVEVARLQDIQCFVSPDAVFRFFERIGFQTMMASRKRADKQMVELLTGATFTLFLDESNDYNVMAVRDDPPDVEVLAVERETRALNTMKLEIAQVGKHSKSVFEVIGKKLGKIYEQGTVLVVVIEETERFLVADVHEFIQENNRHGQKVFILSGAGEAGKFRGLPCDTISRDGADNVEWMEKDAYQRDRNAGFLGLDGVFCETLGLGRFLTMPLFAKKVRLIR